MIWGPLKRFPVKKSAYPSLNRRMVEIHTDKHPQSKYGN